MDHGRWITVDGSRSWINDLGMSNGTVELILSAVEDPTLLGLLANPANIFIRIGENPCDQIMLKNNLNATTLGVSCILNAKGGLVPGDFPANLSICSSTYSCIWSKVTDELYKVRTTVSNVGVKSASMWGGLTISIGGIGFRSDQVASVTVAGQPCEQVFVASSTYRAVDGPRFCTPWNGGVVVASAITLEECRAACSDSSTCTALNWYPVVPIVAIIHNCYIFSSCDEAQLGLSGANGVVEYPEQMGVSTDITCRTPWIGKEELWQGCRYFSNRFRVYLRRLQYHISEFIEPLPCFCGSCAEL